MLKLKATKYHLFQRKVTFLGYVVSDKGIECDPDKTAAIATWPRPANVSEVRTFCSLASYYRAFIKNFAQIARPLHKLTKKNAMIVKLRFRSSRSVLLRHLSWLLLKVKVSMCSTVTHRTAQSVP